MELEKKLDTLHENLIRTSGVLDGMRTAFQDQLKSLSQGMDSRLSESTRSIDARMSESNKTVTEVNKTIRERMDIMARESGKVAGQLSSLGEQTRQLQELGTSIAGLEEILKPPKARGTLGELLLENILGQVLPAGHFETQYKFQDGTIVDAIIKFRDYILPIDSKFPLENFRRMMGAKEKAERLKFYKDFVSDCSKHIDKISRTYIRPADKTLDVAMMYIPAEAVYYHMLVPPEGIDAGKTVAELAWEKRVVPISPNTLHAYLQVILIGLRGMKVEEKAKEIFGTISNLWRLYQPLEEQIMKVDNYMGHLSRTFAELKTRHRKLGDRLPKPEQIQ